VVDHANFIASFAESYVAIASDILTLYCSVSLSTELVISSILEAARKAAKAAFDRNQRLVALRDTLKDVTLEAEAARLKLAGVDAETINIFQEQGGRFPVTGPTDDASLFVNKEDQEIIKRIREQAKARDELNKKLEAYEDRISNVKSVVESSIPENERLKQTLDDLKFAREKQIITEEEYQRAAAATRKAMIEASETGKIAMEALREVNQSVSQGIADILTKSGDGLTNFKDKLVGILNKVIAKLIEAQFEAILFGKALSGSGGGGGLLGGLFSAFAPKTLPLGTPPINPQVMTMAGGGRIQARVPTLVGERGPELFVPNTGGSVMNNMNTRGALGGGRSTSITQNFNVSTGVQQTVRAEIMSMMPIIADKTLAAVIQERQRGGEFADALFG